MQENRSAKAAPQAVELSQSCMAACVGRVSSVLDTPQALRYVSIENWQASIGQKEAEGFAPPPEERSLAP